MMNHGALLALKSFRHSDRGGALVELAVALPVLLLIAIGVADFGRAYFTAISVASAARTAAEFGAQSAATYADTSVINQVGRDEAADAGAITVTSQVYCRCPDGTDPTCTGTCPTGSPGYADDPPEVFVKVIASDSVDLIFRYPGLSQSLFFRDSATFRAQ